MAFRFQKRIKLLPGLRVNLSRSGVSTSIGPKGASLNVGRRGTRATVGIPGTGLSHTQRLGAAPAPGAPSAGLTLFAGLYLVVACSLAFLVGAGVGGGLLMMGVTLIARGNRTLFGVLAVPVALAALGLGYLAARRTWRRYMSPPAG